MEPKTGRKIVSKGRYLVNLTNKFALSSVGILLLLLGLLMTCATFLLILGILTHRDAKEPLMPLAYGVFILGGVSAALLYCGGRAVKGAKHTDAGIPLTRANTADLPAPDTLVRASSEPVQAQEAMLLRAAAEGQETPPEQLVRASVSFSAARSGRPGQE